MLALHGFEAYGLEVAAAETYATSQMKDPSPYNFGNQRNASIVPTGEVIFIEGDYFTAGWETKFNGEDKRVDIIYDYTVIRSFRSKLSGVFKTRRLTSRSFYVLYHPRSANLGQIAPFAC